MPTSESAPEYDESSMHTVRPRWVWIGLAGLLVGLATTGVGVMLGSLAVLVPGLVVLAAGAASALYGRLYYDTRGQAPAPVKAVRENPVYEEPGPEAKSRDEEARERARELDETRRRALAASMRTRLPLLPVGAVLMLTVSAWLMLTQGLAYPASARGQANGLRDLGVAIVVALGSLRLLLTGPRRWISCLMFIAGLCSAVPGFLAAHDSRIAVVSEVASGVLIALGALLTLDRRGTSIVATNPSTPDRTPSTGSSVTAARPGAHAAAAPDRRRRVGPVAMGATAAGLAAAVAAAVRAARRTARP